jgi:Protein of unknown function (DUF2934)
VRSYGKLAMATKKSRKAVRGDSSQGNHPTKPTIDDQELRQRIAETAYELYQRRGEVPGQEVKDWLEAERMVLTKSKQVKVNID